MNLEEVARRSVVRQVKRAAIVEIIQLLNRWDTLTKTPCRDAFQQAQLQFVTNQLLTIQQSTFEFNSVEQFSNVHNEFSWNSF